MNYKIWSRYVGGSTAILGMICFAFSGLTKVMEYVGLSIIIVSLASLTVGCILKSIYIKKLLEDSFKDFLNEEYNNANISENEKNNPSKNIHDEYIKLNSWSYVKYIVLAVLCIAIIIRLLMSINKI